MIKIIQDCVTFNSLKPGQIFEVNSILYMKIYPLSVGYSYNSVILSNGKLFTIKNTLMVTPKLLVGKLSTMKP